MKQEDLTELRAKYEPYRHTVNGQKILRLIAEYEALQTELRQETARLDHADEEIERLLALTGTYNSALSKYTLENDRLIAYSKKLLDENIDVHNERNRLAADLKAAREEVEKLRCCGNCKHRITYEMTTHSHEFCRLNTKEVNNSHYHCPNWVQADQPEGK
jgi:chromosome segregation ATPase